MRVVIPGHKYELDNLRSASGRTTLQFHMDPELHGGKTLEGPSCQEVIRALIDRVSVLEAEKHHRVNEEIIKRLREIIILFEIRAVEYKLEKLQVEKIPTFEDGHILTTQTKLL